MVDERKIVVGVDGSPGSSRALQWAMETGAQYGDEVEAVLAWERVSYPFTEWVLADPVEVPVEAVHALGTQLAKAQADRSPAAVEVRLEGRTIEGDPPTVLTSLPARLLVLGRHGQSAVRRRLLGPALGSVASHCLNNATVPVVIVPAQTAPGPPTRIVVGLDGSASSNRALRWAVTHGRAVGAPVTAVYGWQIATMPSPGKADDDLVGMMPPLPEWQLEAERRLRERVSRALDAHEAAEVQLLALHRPAAAGLLATVHEDDVLVLGERGQGGFARLLLGSVSRHCAEHSPCPIVVVPPRDRTTGRAAPGPG